MSFVRSGDIFLTLRGRSSADNLTSTIRFPSGFDKNKFVGYCYLQITFLGIDDWSATYSDLDLGNVSVFHSLQSPFQLFDNRIGDRLLGVVPIDDIKEDDGAGNLTAKEVYLNFFEEKFPPKIVYYNGEDELELSLRFFSGASFSDSSAINLDNTNSRFDIEVRLIPVDQSKFKALRGDKE